MALVLDEGSLKKIRDMDYLYQQIIVDQEYFQEVIQNEIQLFPIVEHGQTQMLFEDLETSYSCLNSLFLNNNENEDSPRLF